MEDIALASLPRDVEPETGSGSESGPDDDQIGVRPFPPQAIATATQWNHPAPNLSKRLPPLVAQDQNASKGHQLEVPPTGPTNPFTYSRPSYPSLSSIYPDWKHLSQKTSMRSVDRTSHGLENDDALVTKEEFKELFGGGYSDLSDIINQSAEDDRPPGLPESQAMSAGSGLQNPQASASSLLHSIKDRSPYRDQVARQLDSQTFTGEPWMAQRALDTFSQCYDKQILSKIGTLKATDEISRDLSPFCRQLIPLAETGVPPPLPPPRHILELNQVVNDHAFQLEADQLRTPVPGIGRPSTPKPLHNPPLKHVERDNVHNEGQSVSSNERKAAKDVSPTLDENWTRVRKLFPPRLTCESKLEKKKGRSAPPGRCHSCNRAETPEWRRGPDGARTLCNACGLGKLRSLQSTSLQLLTLKTTRN
jgi:hypothetical protein